MTAAFNIKLKILVFGPNPSSPSPPGFLADLAKKREEIRRVLKTDGHEVVFPEDLMAGSVDPDINNACIWEDGLVREYDMVVHLVGSPGTLVELDLFMRDNLALKAALFFREDHVGGLPYAKAKLIEALGAKLHTYNYPNDLVICNLMKQVREKVWAVRVGKYYAS